MCWDDLIFIFLSMLIYQVKRLNFQKKRPYEQVFPSHQQKERHRKVHDYVETCLTVAIKHPKGIFHINFW